MKLFIASDIHGSAEYCQKMIEAFKRENADKMLLLGDILYHGPRNNLPSEYCPKDVISMLNPLCDKIICVRGNCDSEVDQMVLDFPLMADYTVLEVNGISIFASHGHHYNPKTPFKNKNYYILLNGHTHIPACDEYDGFLYLNPGSISIPKENSNHSYMILDEKTFIWKDLDQSIYKTKEIK